ncbi:hypothetical protein BKA66DRAFT_485192 [Pyrenochaeta sp. MPI-SDFR-AT-0127]|nr:hypothetical protein BKA66DRAFT_485192 [Pyrenochaeta sp. MPI-SDFR-AT-0127]
MTVTFGAICSLLQSIENISTRQPRLPLKREKEDVHQVISNWFINQREALYDPNTNGGAVLSALFPYRRKDRVYGLQATLLAKKLIKLLAFNRGQRVLFNEWSTGALGDLGVYTERAMRPWDGTFDSKYAYSIDSIDQLLVQLASKYRFSDEAIRKQRNWHVQTDTLLKDIFLRLESWEAKWLVRLLLRDHCTIDLDETYVYGQYHFLLPDLLMFQNDFDAVFLMLKGELSCYPPHPDPTEEKSMRVEAAQRLRAAVGVKVGRPVFHKAWSFKHCLQLVGKRAWAAEVKYDGEYCEIHVDLNNVDKQIKIFSKNGKDATADRELLLGTIRESLRIGRPECLFETKCIVLGEMVLYSDKEEKIMSFSKIRKHISRSGTFIGTLQDSLPHEWEHLMIVFFDILVLDDKAILRHCLQERRNILRDLVHVIPGRSMRSEWTLLDFKTRDGMTDLKQIFARNIADRQEGLVLKPLHAPYFPLLCDHGRRQAGSFIKMKTDYLGDMGGERDLGDFAIIGASFDAQVAPKTDIKPLHWTHFHLGCCSNKDAVQRTGAKPMFKVVAALSLDKCIPRSDLNYLNIHGYVRQATFHKNGSTSEYNIDYSKGCGRRMAVAFKQPFVAEVLGGGFEKLQNETFEMLRHPRITKIHHDRTWEDAVTLDDLERMAEEKWDVPNADKLDGHAKDVALLVKKYAKELYGSQNTAIPNKGIRASHQSRILIREDISERLNTPALESSARSAPLSSLPKATRAVDASLLRRKHNLTALISPPTSKRRRILSPLHVSHGNRHLGVFDFDSQNRTIHIYAKEGLKVQVHTGSDDTAE